MIPFGRSSRQDDRISICHRVLEGRRDRTTVRQRIHIHIEHLPLPLSLNRHIARSHHDREGRRPTEEVIPLLLRRNIQHSLNDRITEQDGKGIQDGLSVLREQLI